MQHLKISEFNFQKVSANTDFLSFVYKLFQMMHMFTALPVRWELTDIGGTFKNGFSPGGLVYTGKDPDLSRNTWKYQCIPLHLIHLYYCLFANFVLSSNMSLIISDITLKLLLVSYLLESQ